MNMKGDEMSVTSSEQSAISVKMTGETPEVRSDKTKPTRTQVLELGPRAGTKNCALMIIM